MMEIWPALHIGTERDYEQDIRHREGWSIVHACKEPYHRGALGYRTPIAPLEHPEHHVARRGHRLMLNLLDEPDALSVAQNLIDAALDFTDEQLKAGRKVLIHCNLGTSRSPTVGLLYLLSRTSHFRSGTFEEIEARFRYLYPIYSPSLGMYDFARMHFAHYQGMAGKG